MRMTRARLIMIMMMTRAKLIMIMMMTRARLGNQEGGAGLKPWQGTNRDQAVRRHRIKTWITFVPFALS